MATSTDFPDKTQVSQNQIYTDKEELVAFAITAANTKD